MKSMNEIEIYMFIETTCRLDGYENNIICVCLFFSYNPKLIYDTERMFCLA